MNWSTAGICSVLENQQNCSVFLSVGQMSFVYYFNMYGITLEGEGTVITII